MSTAIRGYFYQNVSLMTLSNSEIANRPCVFHRKSSIITDQRTVYFSLHSGYRTIANRNRQPIEIQYYRSQNGRQPFTEWFESIRDKNTQQRIDKRLARLEDGNLGDCQSVGGGVFELRLHFGPGYRVYFGQIKNTLVLLLCGGDKKSQ